VVSADKLKKYPVLQDIMEQILKQTTECGYFIQGLQPPIDAITGYLSS
jgi:hypothetical protein